MGRFMGWAQARARPNMILKSMGRARERAAEYWGEEYYDSDIQVWQLGLPQQLDQMYAMQGEEYRARIDAFAKDINDYATRHPEAIEEGMKRVLPVTAQDVLGHIMRIGSISRLYLISGFGRIIRGVLQSGC